MLVAPHYFLLGVRNEFSRRRTGLEDEKGQVTFIQCIFSILFLIMPQIRHSLLTVKLFHLRKSGAVGALHELASTSELKKALECPICNEVPLAPIYTCTKGHTICGKCREDQRCGICKEDLSKTSRNAAVEMIVASSSFWCKYLSDGCPKTVKGGEYRAHINVCEFRYEKY